MGGFSMIFIKVSILFSFLICVEPKEDLKKLESINVLENVIQLSGSNVRKSGDNYLIDIIAKNVNNNIAGLQFEIIDENYSIVEASGGLAASNGFNFYPGSGGVILAFSLEGKTILATEKKRNNSAYEPLITLEIKKNTKEPADLMLKTIIAGEKGIKLDSSFLPLKLK